MSKYGWLCFRPEWLQRFNTIHTFVAVLFCARALNHGIGDGAVGVMISTIERRFDLRSSQSSWLASIVDVASFVAVALFTLIGRRFNRPCVIALACFTMAIGSIMFCIPHFASPPFQAVASDEKILCNATYTSTCDSTPFLESEDASTNSDQSFDSRTTLGMLLAARLLMGFGYPALSIQAYTFMEEAVKPGRYAFYAALMDVSSLLGTTVTFIGGSSMLKLHTYFYRSDIERVASQDDEGWIGAWWLIFFVIGILFFPCLVLLAGYPGNPQALKNVDATARHVERTTSVPFFKRAFLRSPVFWCVQFVKLLTILAIYGAGSYMPKYVEIAFNLTPTMSGVTVGTVIILSGMTGYMMGGMAIKRFNLNCEQTIKYMMILLIPFTGMLSVFFFGCESNVIQGFSISTINTNSASLQNWCPQSCSCDDIPYSPICGDDGKQYFSPCHAGCTQVNGTTFFDCSCIPSPMANQSLGATFGNCPTSTCWQLYPMMFISFIAYVSVCASQAMHNSAVVRCVSKQDVTSALGFNTANSCLGGVLGPFAVGLLMDAACGTWDYPCGQRGGCLDYNKSQLSLNFSMLWLAMGAGAFILSAIALKFYKPPLDSIETECNDKMVEEERAVSSPIVKKVPTLKFSGLQIGSKEDLETGVALLNGNGHIDEKNMNGHRV